MNLLAIMASPRKGSATDTLVDKAIEGVRAVIPDIQVKKIALIDKKIDYCRGCLSCRDSDMTKPVAPCVIKDDTDDIVLDILNADMFIFATPLRMSHVTAMLLNLFERICWRFAKPAAKHFTVAGCPLPRSTKVKKSVTIITNSIVPPLYRRFCDNASPFIKSTLKDCLNVKTVGDLYAGDLEHRGIDFYTEKAFQLGIKLARKKCSY